MGERDSTDSDDGVFFFGALLGFAVGALLIIGGVNCSSDHGCFSRCHDSEMVVTA
jgi:hypothetical protein